jgi:predicted CoA-substrate-specific enzyme activase
MSDTTYFAGLDLGSAFTKAVVISREAAILGTHVERTGISFETNAEKVFEGALAKAGVSRGDVRVVGATGVGRRNCPFATVIKPEIGCFAKGVYFHHRGHCMVIDIGGQDNKVIRVSQSGQQEYFKMNRKCAAGTGAFLEEISFKLNVPQQEMNARAQRADRVVSIGSYCTVFSATEIIHHIREGKDIDAIFRGVYESVVKRVLEMDPIADTVVLAGGAIANNSVLVDLFREKLPVQVIVPPSPQTLGALGAALYARDGAVTEDLEDAP